MKKSIFLISFLFIIQNIYSVTYYVSPSGNNSNNGLTSGTAFLTLQYASDQTIPGDVVNVLPGVYAGFTQTTSGNVTDRILFSAQAGVLINAPNLTNDGINLEGASYITIEGFEVYGMPRAGLRSVLNTGVEFRNNKIDSCGKWGILTGFSDNILIEGNECSRSVIEHGIYFGNSADNPIIRRNHCWGNNANGIHMNGDVSLQPGDGIISNALVEENIIHDNGNAGGSGINCDGVQFSTIRNNLLYNNHASGISLYKIDGGGGSINNLVVNNTILQPVVSRWALNISDSSTGNIVFNNIFYSDHSFRGSISIDAGSITGFKSNFNVLTDRMSDDGGNSNMTMAQWQQATLQDTNSLIATPAQMFIDAANNDYHLLINSPAKDAGTNNFGGFNAPISDLDGIVRPLDGQWDIGAYEFPGSIGIAEIDKPSWKDISPDKLVRIYDSSGRLLISEKKFSADEKLKNMNGVFIFNVDGKSNILIRTDR